METMNQLNLFFNSKYTIAPGESNVIWIALAEHNERGRWDAKYGINSFQLCDSVAECVLRPQMWNYFVFFLLSLRVRRVAATGDTFGEGKRAGDTHRLDGFFFRSNTE